MDQQKIGKFICSLRKEKNLSQTQLADMIPISRQAVSKWERGITIPDSSVLIKLSEIFAVSINEILAGEKIPKKSIKTLEKVTVKKELEDTKEFEKVSPEEKTIDEALNGGKDISADEDNDIFNLIDSMYEGDE